MIQLLAQFSIRAKIFGLIVLGVLASLIIGVNGISGASSMFDLTKDMHDNALKPVYLLGQAAKQAAYVNRADYRYIAETEKAQMDQVQINRDKFEAAMVVSVFSPVAPPRPTNQPARSRFTRVTVERE